jgi:CBS domain-containing protein
MRVAELMTTDVLTVGVDAPLKQVAELLAGRGISGAPVVDAAGHLVGVVSEADILAKERRPQRQSRLGRMLGYTEQQSPKAAARTAGEAMTSPPVTIAADRRADAAAALMLDRQVNRLPVVDRDGKLVGIVTRADLVRAFVTEDETIEQEIRDDVLLHELWLDPSDFSLTVEAGEVTVVGHIETEGERGLLERRIRLVPGVVSVTVKEPTTAA